MFEFREPALFHQLDIAIENGICPFSPLPEAFGTADFLSRSIPSRKAQDKTVERKPFFQILIISGQLFGPSLIPAALNDFPAGPVG